MVVQLGQMQLPAPQDPDPSDDYFNGTISGGGLWTALTRASDHDHTGGVSGKPISVASLPDGSITTSKLDPSVLLPYTLVDGSKPFTDQVTMQADAVVRDALYFGQQGSALAPDVTLARTSAGALRLDTNLGVGVAPHASWTADRRVVQIGEAAAVYAVQPGVGAGVGSNSRWDGANKAVVAGASTVLTVGPGTLAVSTAPSVAAGAAQTFTARLAVALTGTTTLSPDAGAAALVAGGHILPVANVAQSVGGPGQAFASFYCNALTSPSTFLITIPNGSVVGPAVDNQVYLGGGSNRWTMVYAANGAIQTSSREYKEDITPLDPAAAMEAVRNTPAVTFDYVPPARGPDYYDLPDDPEQAEVVLQQRLTAAPLEAAARHQHGFIAEAADELFLVGPGQTSPGSSIGVLLAALQQLDARVQTLEGAA